MRVSPPRLRTPPLHPLVLLASGLWTACHLMPPPTRPPEPPPEPAALRDLPSGGSVAIQRPTPGWARLSLWLDAGALDAEPPALATLTARWAARHAHADARVLPGATEIFLDCDLARDRLARCVRRLGRALSAPSPDENALRRVVADLVEERRQQAADPYARLDHGALSALLGIEEAAAMQPLGVAEDDPKLTSAGVEQFLRDHYGPNRALLVGAGDVAPRDLEGWATGLSPARRGRVRRALQPGEGGVRAFVGPVAGMSLVLAAPSVERAAQLGRAFLSQHPDAEIRAFGVGGAAFSLLRLPLPRDPWNALRTATFDALRLSLELPRNAPVPPGADDLVSLTRRTGEAWAGGDPVSAGEPPWPLGVALARPSPEPLAPEREGAESKALAAWLDRAEEAVEQARAQLAPRLRGDADADRASVSLPNGVRIEIERRPHDGRFAALLEVAGGAAHDAPGEHGRSALLASLAASACAFASAPALAEQLRQEGTRMRPLVSAERWGVLADGDSAAWRTGTDRLLRCGLRPSFRARDVEDARLRLLSQLHRTRAARFAWEAAETLLPEAPGTLSPWGSPEGVAAVPGSSLRRLHQQTLRGGAVTLRLIVPADASVAATFVARRVAQLAAGDAPETPAPAPHPLELRGARSDDGSALRVWVGVARAGQRGAGEAVRAAGEQVAHRLHALAGYEVAGVAGDSGPVSWIWVELWLHDPTLLDAVPGAVEAAFRGVRRSLPDALERSVAEARARRHTRASDPVELLRQHFLREDAADVSRGVEQHVRDLLETRPSFVVLGPVVR